MRSGLNEYIFITSCICDFAQMCYFSIAQKNYCYLKRRFYVFVVASNKSFLPYKKVKTFWALVRIFQMRMLDYQPLFGKCARAFLLNSQKDRTGLWKAAGKLVMPLFESPLSVLGVKPNSQASITDLFNIHLI